LRRRRIFVSIAPMHDKTGWNTPLPAEIPRPTAWPPAMALGIAFFGWGFVTSPIVLGVGASLFLLSLAGWIAEIRHERRQA
jgi:hypothetical protein